MRRFILLAAVLLAIAHGQYNQYNQNQRNQPYQQQQQNGNGQQGYQPNQNQYGNNMQNNNNMQNRYQQQSVQQSGYVQQGNQRMTQTNQQMQYGQQFPAGAQQQAANKGTSRSVHSNTPIKAVATGTNGARLDIQLTSYSNPGNLLSNTTSCTCPIGNCQFLKANEQNNCQFSFATVISASDQTVKYIQSDFETFSHTITTGNWTHPISMELGTKPVAVDVLVHHLGVVINKADANLLYFNHLALVDTFALPLLSLDPSQGNGQATVSTTLKSQLQPSSSLTMKITVACINNFMGSNCDLLCGQGNTTINSNSNSGVTLCKNVISGHYLQCKTVGANQVNNCFTCTDVNLSTNKCTLVGDNTVAPVGVAYAFKVWTIVLGVLLGLALLLIICLIIAYIICRNRDRDEEEEQSSTYKPSSHPYRDTTLPAHQTQTSEWTSPARRPLLPAVDHDVSRQSEDSYMRGGMTTTVHTTTSTQQRQEHQV